jgi:hypothetical protein
VHGAAARTALKGENPEKSKIYRRFYVKKADYGPCGARAGAPMRTIAR